MSEHTRPMRRRLAVLPLVLALAVVLVAPAAAETTTYWGEGDLTRNNGGQTWVTEFDTTEGTMSARRTDTTGVWWEAEIACTALVGEDTLLFGGYQQPGDGDRERYFIAIEVVDGGTPGGGDDEFRIATLENEGDVAAHCGGTSLAGGSYVVTAGDIVVHVEHTPDEVDECKKRGWESYGFRNQGLCMQFVNTGKDSR